MVQLMSKKVAIGAWSITPDQNKLSLDEKNYFIEPRAMEVLVYFAKNPDKVISLEELVDNVWKGRVVGDHAIYRVINQIRKTLSVDNDVSYITTIRKKGYQLNQPVSWIDSGDTSIQDQQGSTELSTPETAHRATKKWLIATCLFLLFISVWIGSKYLIKSINYNSVQPFNVVKPFSVLIGEEKDASFSPDGQYISFSHLPKSGDHFKLYVQSLDGESPVQITSQAGDDFSPSWSPDGTQIVFIRHIEGMCQIMKVNITRRDSRPEKVVDCNASGLPNEVVWGKEDHLYYTDSSSTVEPYKIYRYSLKTTKKEQLTNPESGKSKGDIHIALSNNEDQIAFTRDLNWGNTQVKLLDLKTRKIADLFLLKGWRKALTWSFDDRYLYHIDEDENIKAYSLKYGFLKTVFINSDTLHSISGHRGENKLAVMTGETGIDIWGSDLANQQVESPVIESSEIDLYPEFAHNSNNIAFMSLRSGQPQIWVKSADGREYQLSKFTDGRSVQRIRWSPDDQKILSSTDNELYIIDVDTRSYTTIWKTEKPFRIEVPNWSPSGNSVYFSSDIDGDWQIYKKQLGSNSEPTKITERGGYSPEISDNREMLYYKYHETGIWKMQLDTGIETKLVDDKDVSTIRTIENPLMDYTISNDSSVILYPKLLNEETEIRILEKD